MLISMQQYPEQWHLTSSRYLWFTRNYVRKRMTMKDVQIFTSCIPFEMG